MNVRTSRSAGVAQNRGHSRWVPAFLVLSAVWGSSFLLIKITVDAGVGPIWVGLWRCVLGATALWLICAVSRVRVPRDLTAWGHAAVVALLLNAIPFPLFAYGETKISSVLAGVWNATAPLATLALAFVLVPDERPSARRLAGIATGFLGVLVVLGIWRGIDAGPLVGTLACLGAAICYGAAFAYARRFLSDRKESATALATIQVTCATLQLALVAPLAEGAPRWPGWGATSALVALGVLGHGSPEAPWFSAASTSSSPQWLANCTLALPRSHGLLTGPWLSVAASAALTGTGGCPSVRS